MSFAVKEIKDTEDAKDVEEHWGREVRALRTMNGLNQDHIVRFVTAFRRKSNFGNEHYLIFEWADGGNLCDLWRRMPSPVPTAQVIKDIVKQILGLAKALEAAHNLNETGASYRHGDIKPENILVFRGKTSVSSDEESIGTFKIADWGEAREHEQATEMRPNKTVAKYGTRRYEALEVETGVPSARLGTVKKRRSRLYDIWAMGCITLELIIWLLYGADGVKRFHKDLGNDSFYEIVENKGTKEAKANSRLNEETVTKEAMVHSIVKKWMDHMAAQPGCEVGTTAIGNLLEIVQTALLVVKLPQRLGTTISHQTERLRRDSATTSLGIGGGDVVSSESNFEEDAATYAEKPRSDIPSFRITPADPVPIEPSSGLEPELRGHYRCLATDFRRRLEVINGEDEDETYWGITGSQRPMPGSTSMSFPDSPLDHGTVTDGSGVCAGNSDPINQSLVVSEKKKVSIIRA
jgi:serine/threonine protein kinase